MKQFFKEKDIEADFIIISNADEFLKYRTWILPTIIINGKIVTRGYRPSKNKMLNSVDRS